MSPHQRTVIAAMYPTRFRDSFTEIMLKVWFEELPEPVEFCATPFDCERHGKALWIRTMAGEFGEITVIDEDTPIKLRELPSEAVALIENTFSPPKLLDDHGSG